ncbi:MAG: hypothetical protein QOD51_803 [Candidatus Eremiobacteraeota bacterium]|nr:hypothetical protein [Candidatus Eremiobacteraeota bacterium]
MKRCVIALSLGLLALAGCSGGGGTMQQTVIGPCPTVAISDAQAHLVSPPSGATGVSPSIGSISVAYGTSAVLSFIQLTPGDGSPSVSGNASFTGVLPSSGVVAVTIPALKPATKYTVTGQNADFAHIVGCFAKVTADFGSFTTQ